MQYAEDKLKFYMNDMMEFRIEDLPPDKIHLSSIKKKRSCACEEGSPDDMLQIKFHIHEELDIDYKDFADFPFDTLHFNFFFELKSF